MKPAKHDTFFSNGNLIITGEYFVLTGAIALALPLKYGQIMKVGYEETNSGLLNWEATEFGKPWFLADFYLDDLDIKDSSNKAKAKWLQRLLRALSVLNPGIFDRTGSYHINSDIQFNRDWGWGSSATLISNLAYWAEIDPFKLNSMISNGSGYDIAASRSDVPFFYKKDNESIETHPASFNPSFRNSIFFIFLGKKQDTSSSINEYIKSVKDSKGMIAEIDSLTRKIANGKELKEFMINIGEHEKILSATLNVPRIKDKYFSDFDGEIKSLGAWGGDFAMAVSEQPETNVRSYFKEKRLDTIFRFDEIIRV